MEDTKIWDRDEVQHLITTNNQALYKALVMLYGKQTQTETALGKNTEHNGVGFTGYDAEILTSFVTDYYKYGQLSDGQLAVARRRLPKYWKQLLGFIEKRGGKADYNAHIRRARRAKKDQQQQQAQLEAQ